MVEQTGFDHLPIGDYAVIGNTHTAALVGRNGSVDWMCVPNFDSPACFAALVGDRDNGRWLIQPDVPFVARRHYRGETMILETTLETDSGRVRLVDFMPIQIEGDRSELVRLVCGESGVVPMRTEVVARFDYGHFPPWAKPTDYGWVMISGPDALQLDTPVELQHGDGYCHGRFDVAAGQVLAFQIGWFPSHETEPELHNPQELLDDAERWWNEWAARCPYEGEWREPLIRSLLTLKCLTHAPTGATVAAATTSLPEMPGGIRNWDYRICWLRDSTFLLYALRQSGYLHEAERWRAWLLRAAAGEPLRLQIMYGIHGERRLDEQELPWLAGHCGAVPVRSGNGAYTQFQLDVYGELMDSLYLDREREIPPDDDAWNVQLALMEGLERRWREPDNGIWESRGELRHFTHSKMMAWVAFDRAIKMVERHGRSGDVPRWRLIRDEIHAEVCSKGFDPELGSFVQYYGSKHLDGSLLMMPIVGFLPIDDPRMAGTVRAIQRHLTIDGLVLRYRTETGVDALPPGEGTFLACSFWLVDCLVMLGEVAEARRLFERLLGIRNDVGLLSEEYAPRDDRLLGNFPQAMSHVALINTIHNLTKAAGPAQQRSAG